MSKSPHAAGMIKTKTVHLRTKEDSLGVHEVVQTQSRRRPSAGEDDALRKASRGDDGEPRIEQWTGYRVLARTSRAKSSRDPVKACLGLVRQVFSPLRGADADGAAEMTSARAAAAAVGEANVIRASSGSERGQEERGTANAQDVPARRRRRVDP